MWTIDDLGARVAAALSADQPGRPNGRVREVPDLRTIRYYTTLGLIDRPADMRGRTALYGRRHLMQLVAIKRLQARGLSLADTQQQLVGLTDPALSRLARLPAGLEEMVPPVPHVAAPAGVPPVRGSQAFWKAAPETPSEAAAPRPAACAVADEQRHDSLQDIRLGNEVLLLLSAARPVHEEDVQALRAAAAPLIKVLEARRLLRSRQERGKP